MLVTVLCSLVRSFFVEESKFVIIEKELCTAHAAFTPHVTALSIPAIAGEILQLAYSTVTAACKP